MSLENNLRITLGRKSKFFVNTEAHSYKKCLDPL